MTLLMLELFDRWDRQVAAELLVRRDTVEIRCQDIVAGVADRDFLRGWLRRPSGMYAYDDCAWLACGNGIALAIDDVVPAMVLSDAVYHDVRVHV